MSCEMLQAKTRSADNTEKKRKVHAVRRTVRFPTRTLMAPGAPCPAKQMAGLGSCLCIARYAMRQNLE